MKPWLRFVVELIVIELFHKSHATSNQSSKSKFLQSKDDAEESNNALESLKKAAIKVSKINVSHSDLKAPDPDMRPEMAMNQKIVPKLPDGVIIDEDGEEWTTSYALRYKTPAGNHISPWHDIPLQPGVEGIFNAVIEIPKMSTAKMEVATTKSGNPIQQDVSKGKLRFYHGPIFWNYGMLPQTWEDPTTNRGDNDPVDVVEIGSQPIGRGSVVEVKPLGALAMIDQLELDWKIIAVRISDPDAAKYNDIHDVPESVLSGIREWFRWYKVPDGKPMGTFGHPDDPVKSEEYKPKADALNIVDQLHQAWKKLQDGTVNPCSGPCQDLWLPVRTTDDGRPTVDEMPEPRDQNPGGSEPELPNGYSTMIEGTEKTSTWRLKYTHNGNVISPWHDIPLRSENNNGNGATKFNMLVEVPKMTTAKMEIVMNEDWNPVAQEIKKGGNMRFLNGPIFWNYGVFPQTWESPCISHAELGYKGDNAPLDVVEIGSKPMARGSVIEVKPLGSLAMIDDGKLDWKIIAVRIGDPLSVDYNNIDDVPYEVQNGIREWFRWYKVPDGSKPAEFEFRESVRNRDPTLQVIDDSNVAWQGLKNGDACVTGVWRGPENLAGKAVLNGNNETNRSEVNPADRSYATSANKEYHVTNIHILPQAPTYPVVSPVYGAQFVASPPPDLPFLSP